MNRCRLAAPSGLAVLCGVAMLAAAPAPCWSQLRSAGTAPAVLTRLQPRFRPGEVRRYRMEFQTSSDAKPSGGIEDPEGPTRVGITWDAVIRVEVLGEPPGSAARPPRHAPDASQPPPAVRLRTTYERSVATVTSDSPDPQTHRIESQYARLQGRSIEFTLAGDGSVSGVRGLQGILPGRDAEKAAREWMAQFSAGVSAPAGVSPGQHWTTQQPADSLPLAGRVWRTDSTYLRNEPCHPSAPSGAAPGGEQCAVILSRLVLLPPRSKGDPTPPDYRRNGLRTAGIWRGTGESLTYVSLRTGWVVSVTQTSTEQMDVRILRGTVTAMHYAGTVSTRSSVSLVPAPAAPSH